MNRRKTIITAIVLILVLIIGGVLAYLTDTETKTNVFTLGNVNIALYEEDWEEITAGSGRYQHASAELRQILPGATVPKAPFVANEGTSGSGQSAYIFLKVEIPYGPLTTGGASTELFTLDNLDTTHWQLVSSTNSTNTCTKVYVYGAGLTENAMTALTIGHQTEPLFRKVTLKEDYDPATVPSSLEIEVTAYGIQTELDYTTPSGSTDAAAIFALFN